MRNDTLRCRYSDCAEQHPVASGEEQVTCPACREWLGLPPTDGEGDEWLDGELADAKGRPAVAHPGWSDDGPPSPW